MSGTGSGNSVGSHADGHGKITSPLGPAKQKSSVPRPASCSQAGEPMRPRTGLSGSPGARAVRASRRRVEPHHRRGRVPAAGNVLYPGGSGDVVLTISNPNPYPVTVTAVNLPTNTTYATGYTTSALTTTQAAASLPPRVTSFGTSRLRLRAAPTPSRPRLPSTPLARRATPSPSRSLTTPP